jgi:hypothetical protein
MVSAGSFPAIIKLKSKSPQKEASAEVSLAGRIKETCAAAEQYIESRVQQEKAGSGASLPLSWLRQNIYAVHKARGCHCRCALSLLSEKK